MSVTRTLRFRVNSGTLTIIPIYYWVIPELSALRNSMLSFSVSHYGADFQAGEGENQPIMCPVLSTDLFCKMQYLVDQEVASFFLQIRFFNHNSVIFDTSSNQGKKFFNWTARKAVKCYEEPRQNRNMISIEQKKVFRMVLETLLSKEFEGKNSILNKGQGENDVITKEGPEMKVPFVMGYIWSVLVWTLILNLLSGFAKRFYEWSIIFLTSYCTLICCRSVARSFPTNLIILAFFTIAAGMMLMVLCAKASPQAVLLAVITTTICCTAIILFATQTSIDITSYIFIIFAASIAVFIFGVVLAILSIFMYIKALHIIFSAVVCVLFMVYLAVDIQLIVGGRKYEISPEEYVFAALMLFVDIYEIFITLLSLFQQAE